MKQLLLLVTFLLFSSVLPAEENDSLLTVKEYYMSAVTVTGTRGVKNLDNTPIVTRIITAEEIKKIDATNIKDVLETIIPGLEFSYSMNQQVSMRLQGLGGMSVLFLVDGERMAGETLDNIDFARLGVDNIERIEIVHGAASALYGSNSVGAVVNIITKDESDPWELHLKTRYGNRYGERTHGLSYSVNHGRVKNFFDLQYDKQDSYNVYDQPTELNGMVIRLTTPIYGAYNWNVKDKLTYQIADGHQLIGRGGYYFRERNSSVDQKDRARDFNGGIRYVGKVSEKGTLDIGYTADRYDKSDYYPAIDKDFLDYKNIQHNLKALYSHNINKSLVMIAGGDAMRDYLKSYQFNSNHDHYNQYTADVYSQVDWTIDKHWNMIGACRADYFSKYGWELSPKFSAMYKVSDFHFRSSYSKGFRAPTLKEMYMDFNMAGIFHIYGNEHLKSEHTNSFSLSAEYLKKYYYISLTGYFNMIDNKIATIWDPTLSNNRGAMKYQNIDGTNLANIEAMIVARYPNGINAKLSYNYFHEFTRHGMPNMADTRPHSIIAQMDYLKTWKNYELNAVINGRFLSKATFNTYVNGRYDHYEQITSEAYTLWKLTLIQKFYKWVTLTMSVDNIFNYKPKTYAYNSPYTLGTSFNIGLQLEINQLAKLTNLF